MLNGVRITFPIPSQSPITSCYRANNSSIKTTRTGPKPYLCVATTYVAWFGLIPICWQVLILHGTSDAVTSPTASQEFYNALPASDKKISLYEVRHSFPPLLISWCPGRENTTNYRMRMMAYRSDWWKRSLRGSRPILLPRLQRVPSYNKCYGRIL